MLLAALFYAPWDYGATTERGIVVLSWGLAGAGILWVLPAFVRRSGLGAAGYGALALIVLGAWMVMNARAIYDSEQQMFIRLRVLVLGAAGSVDQAVSAAWMLRAFGLLAAMAI